MERSEPDCTDYDEPSKYGWCRHCQKETVTVKRDVGIGRYEAWGCKGIHIDMRDHCGDCGEEI
ncbi:MAG TPA: hypothetical protein VF783_13865 [Terriglobales bacterium]